MATDKRFGWVKDRPDLRDHKFSLKKLDPIKSVYINHTHRFPLPYDQGMLGSCVANAIAFQVQVNLLNNRSLAKYPPFTPSRLFMYYYQRRLINTVQVDSGAYIRDGIKVVANEGAPSEDLWHYNLEKFRDEPPQKARDKGIQFQALEYQRIDNTDKQLLVSALNRGLPITFGFYVFSSFVSHRVRQSGIVAMPNFNEEFILGGHAMSIVGYRQADDSFICRNSWGIDWGQRGYCRMPAAYITNPWLADDFWVISQME